ncbi:hypothetical protein [Mycobacteroides abscessus]|uniref:hypothetical protein n=1 Tax=Mycobacteroides abscessus TaxID=36809 RepID=UPI001877804E|nr:hypothetical protein [Mycobacteroides abscessus]
MMTHDRNFDATNAFRVPPAPGYAPPITDKGVGRCFVRMLADAVERGDYAEAYRVVRGAEAHFGYVAANPQAVVR